MSGNPECGWDLSNSFFNEFLNRLLCSQEALQLSPLFHCRVSIYGLGSIVTQRSLILPVYIIFVLVFLQITCSTMGSGGAKTSVVENEDTLTPSKHLYKIMWWKSKDINNTCTILVILWSKIVGSRIGRPLAGTILDGVFIFKSFSCR